jgi:drug/metabolite transporter (DMT)-like permease
MQQASDWPRRPRFFSAYDPLRMKERVRRLAPFAWCLAAAGLFGASPPIAKALLARIHPIQLAGLLYLGAAAAVLPFSLRGGSRERLRHPRHLGYLAGAVVTGGIVGPLLLVAALAAARSASVSLWLNLEAVITAVLAWLFFREHLGRRALFAVALVVAAGAILAAPEGASGARAAVLVLLACAAWGLDNNLTALIDGLTPAQCTLVKGTVAGAINLAVGIAVSDTTPPLDAALVALAVGGLGYGLSIALYIRGAQELGATRAQLIFATAPVAGLAIAWTALAEPVLTSQLIATGLVAIGVGLLARSGHEHEHEHEAMTHSHSHRHDDGHHDHPHPGLAPSIRHTHEHSHRPIRHLHPHVPDLHHRHRHRV